MADIRITYETLFDLLRREKNREELQELDQDFYEQVLAYLKEKKDSLSKKGDELFVSAEKEKLKIQFQNIRRIIKELYERREKKIINMSVSRARTGSDIMDTSPLLPSEKEFFKEQVLLLIKYKDQVLDSILHLKGLEQAARTKAPKEKPKAEEQEKDAGSEKKDKNKADNKPEEDTGPEKESAETLSNQTRKIKIIASLPEFVGSQGEVLGPFNKGDEVELEAPIASLLVKKGNAQPVS